MMRHIATITAATFVCFGLLSGCASPPDETDTVAAADDSMTNETSAFSGGVKVGETLETTADLNLRTGPSTSHSVITVIPDGHKVTVVGTNHSNGWYNVEYNGHKGWSSGLYLKTVSSGGGGGGSGTCGSTPGSGNEVTRWNNVVTCVLKMLGQPASAAVIHDVDIVIKYESSGDPNAINNWDSNAKAGHPSTGLVQVIRPTFDEYRSSKLPNDLRNPAANIYAGMNYAIHRYGSISRIPGVESVNNGGAYRGYFDEISLPSFEEPSSPAGDDEAPIPVFKGR